MKNKLLVLSRHPEVFKEKLAKLNLPDLEINIPSNKEEAEKIIHEANIILAVPTIAKSLINQAKKLVWMQSVFAGVDSLIEPDLRSDYMLTNVKDTYGKVMSEYVLAYILMFEKKIIENLEWQKQKNWNQIPYTTLDGLTIGILGTGSIGKEIAATVKNLDFKVLGYRTERKPVENFDEIYDQKGIANFLEKSDFVICVLPNTPKTNQLINEDFFNMMKPSSVFINIGRGNIVCEKSLTEALKQSKIKAAVLDVFQTEPLPAESELWSLTNLYITPHVSGYIINDKIFEIFEENYLRFVKGEPLKYQIDFSKGY